MVAGSYLGRCQCQHIGPVRPADPRRLVQGLFQTAQEIANEHDEKGQNDLEIMLAATQRCRTIPR